MEMLNKHTRCKIIAKHVVSEPPSTYKLSEEQFQYYKENGFLVIKRLMDFTDLYNYKQHFLRICKGLEQTFNMTVVKERTLMGTNTNKEDYINKLQDIMYDKVFMTYCEHPLILDVVAQFIGDDITLINSMFINKPPGASVHPPHQDLHYFPYRPAEKLVGVWTAIDDTTVENGCLWVVPGSHRENTLYPHTNLPGALKLYHGIGDESVAPPHKRVPLEMSPGDTVFLHPVLVHGSGANISKNYRKSLSAHYMKSDCEWIDLRGTAQDIVRQELEAEAQRRGLEGVKYEMILRYRNKEVRKKSQL